MKVNEVRFNNWANFKFKGVDYGNVMIDKNYFSHYENKDYEYTPIPLTEEWLLKLGFDKTNKGVGFVSWHYSKEILQDSDTLYFRSAGDGYGYFWGFNNDIELNNVQPVEYVHQLQNLYYALTGKELTIIDVSTNNRIKEDSCPR